MPYENNPALSKAVNDKLKKEYERDHQKIKGRFRFLEVPNGTLVFSFAKYKNDPIYRYTLQDNEIVELPYMVAKHLATNVYTSVFQNQLDENGRQIHVPASKIHRTSFERIDFDDDSFIPSPIVTLENKIITQ